MLYYFLWPKQSKAKQKQKQKQKQNESNEVLMNGRNIQKVNLCVVQSEEEQKTLQSSAEQALQRIQILYQKLMRSRTILRLSQSRLIILIGPIDK